MSCCWYTGARAWRVASVRGSLSGTVLWAPLSSPKTSSRRLSVVQRRVRVWKPTARLWCVHPPHAVVRLSGCETGGATTITHSVY
jgi:hypothetical protein